MAEIDELRRQFIVDDNVIKGRLELLVKKAMAYCVLDKTGRVHFSHSNLPARKRVKLVLAARALGARLDEKISAEVSLDELSESTGLQRDQLRARTSEIVKSHFAETTRPGVFRAFDPKIQAFLESMK